MQMLEKMSKEDISDFIRQIAVENRELLERLASDYDEDGKAYWEKWNMEECECGKLRCPKCSEVGY